MTTKTATPPPATKLAPASSAELRKLIHAVLPDYPEIEDVAKKLDEASARMGKAGVTDKVGIIELDVIPLIRKLAGVVALCLDDLGGEIDNVRELAEADSSGVSVELAERLFKDAQDTVAFFQEVKKSTPVTEESKSQIALYDDFIARWSANAVELGASLEDADDGEEEDDEDEDGEDGDEK